MNFIEELKNARTNNLKYKLFKNVYPSENDFNFFIDFVKNHNYGKYRAQAEGVHIRESLFIDSMQDIKNSQNFLESIKESYGNDYHSQTSFTLLVSEKEMGTYEGLTGVTLHSDPQDNIHWNNVGKSLWVIDNQDTFTMDAGDILYIRSGTVHEVKTIKPRAAIIFSI